MNIVDVWTLFYAGTACIICDINARPCDRYSVGGVGQYAGTPLNAQSVTSLWRAGYIETPPLKTGDKAGDSYRYQITPKGRKALRFHQQQIDNILEVNE